MVISPELNPACFLCWSIMRLTGRMGLSFLRTAFALFWKEK